jgi:hypothetical protein
MDDWSGGMLGGDGWLRAMDDAVGMGGRSEGLSGERVSRDGGHSRFGREIAGKLEGMSLRRAGFQASGAGLFCRLSRDFRLG